MNGAHLAYSLSKIGICDPMNNFVNDFCDINFTKNVLFRKITEKIYESLWLLLTVLLLEFNSEIFFTP